MYKTLIRHAFSSVTHNNVILKYRNQGILTTINNYTWKKTVRKDKLKIMKRPLLKLYAFNFFQALSWASQKKRAHSPHQFLVLLFCLFGFLFLFSLVLAFPLFFSLVPTYKLSQRFGAE